MRGKNRLHLDVRRGPDEPDPTERLIDLGAREAPSAADLPWRVFTDPSGNPFCVLDPPAVR